MTSPLQGEDRRFDSAPAHQSYKRRKALGQNFLVNEKIAQRIVDAAEITDDEDILEIGPGRGILTERLARMGKSLTAVEKDKWLYTVMKQRLRGENIKIIEGDIMKVDTPNIDVIVSNIPYSISSPLLFRLFESKWDRAIIMFQEEFANRLIATHGTKQYGRLTVMASMHVKCKKLFRVSRNMFLPQPKVHSVVVELKREIPDYGVKDLEVFDKVVRAIFTHRRKTLKNALKTGFENLEIEKLPFMDLRGEVLKPKEIAHLANKIVKLK